MRRLLLIAGLLATAGGGAAANDLCGTTVTADLKLDHDLVCSANGLVVGTDGVRIDLNGHTIAGSGGGVGVSVIGRADVTMTNGVIRNFGVGVQMNTATGIVVRQTHFLQNGDGIDAQAGSVGNTIKENVFQEHTVRAIMLRSASSDNDIKNNMFDRNRIGVLVFGATDTELKDNLVAGSTLAGIRFNVIATGNVVKDNTLSSNAAALDFLITPTGSASGNELKGNLLSGNTCAVKGPASGNTFKGNTLDGNTADSCS